jgi:hypothetical protein
LNRQADTFAHLLHQSGLANLARPFHHLNEAARLSQAAAQDLKLGALIRQLQFTQLTE